MSRDLGLIRMEAQGVELLELATHGGLDEVTTTGLVDTVQILRDGPDDLEDTVTLDAQGLCASRVGDSFSVVGRQPINFFGFGSARIVNDQCGALLDVSGRVLRYTDSAAVANQLRVTRSGEAYVVTDAAATTVTLTDSACLVGCVASDARTVRCPRSAIASIEVAAAHGDDRVDLSGTDVPARIEGDEGEDVLIGGSADDVFIWNPGERNDTIDGCPGFDTVQFNGTGAAEMIEISADGAGFRIDRNLGSIRVQAVGAERLELSTAGGLDVVTTRGLVATEQRIVDGDDGEPGDTLIVDARGLCATRDGDRYVVEGAKPIDFVRFTRLQVENVFCRPDPCASAVPTSGCIVNGVRDRLCRGTSGKDTIVGTKGDDVILAGDGDDRVRAGGGNDLVCGEAGNDALGGGPGDDTLVGGAGEDRLTGAAGDDTLLGGGEDDVLSGGTGDDELDGGPGDDRVRGLGGTDRLQGGAGFDRLDGGPASDTCEDADQQGPFPRCELPL